MNKLIKNHQTIIYIMISLIVVLAVSCYKYNPGEINYRNSDATWHTLLTIQAYEETPIRVHKFLPIVTLGAPENKGIPWGLYLGDAYGNYYYTSFSSVGFFLPWVFIKIINLPINEASLYIFNTLLFCLAAIAWLILVSEYYRENPNKKYLVPLAMLAFIFVPEVMHGMGHTYWHQSLMQVTLPLQMLAFLLWHRRESRRAKFAFFALTLINPMIEWTGYVANVGFAILEYALTRKVFVHKKNIAWIVGLTAAAFGLLCLHYLQAVSLHDFISTLFARFHYRSFDSDNSTLGIYESDIFSGYIRSFFAWWGVVGVLMIWALIQNGKIEFRNKHALFILAFIGLENLLMFEHATRYSYDRMKMIYLIAFVSCELCDQILNHASNIRISSKLIIGIALICGVFNLNHYVSSDEYIWHVNYRTRNQQFADYINANYPDSILATRSLPRGYITLLFHRNIFERPTQILRTAEKRNIRYAIMLHFEGEAPFSLYPVKINPVSIHWNMPRLVKAVVYDLQIQNKTILTMNNTGEIVKND